MSKVSDAFATFKSRLELTKTEQDDASRRQKDVRATVQASFDVDHDFLAGSYGRHTKTKPLKDIDIFVVLGTKESERRKAHPKAVLDDLEACLVDAYGRDQVVRDRRCVTGDTQRSDHGQEPGSLGQLGPAGEDAQELEPSERSAHRALVPG